MWKLIFPIVFVVALVPFCQAKNYPTPADEDVLIRLGFTKETKTGLDPENINILVWNMYKGDKAFWAMDFKTLSTGKDILLLQEGFLNHNMKSLFELNGNFVFDFATSFLYKKENNTPTGVVTGSHVPPIHVSFSRSPGREPILHTPKVTAITEHKIEGRDETLMAANIHGINFVAAGTLQDQLVKIMQVLEKHQGPLLFAGDFNAWTNRKQKKMRQVMASLGMTEVTFANDIRKRFRGEILDYIFVRGMEVLKSEVHPVEKGSDHPAMTVKLRLK